MSESNTAGPWPGISERMRAVESRIAAAAVSVHRAPSEITLIVVTKTWPAEAVAAVRRAGARHVGENRDQEGARKRADLIDLDAVAAASGDEPPPTLTWHCIGQVQGNKVRSIAAWADAVHGLDRVALVSRLDRAVADAQRTMDVLVQVSLDAEPEPGRGGVAPADLDPLVDQILAAPSLTLRGVMGVAPLGIDPAAAFERLAQASAHVRTISPTAAWISAGMSGDLEDAIAAGATHVRVGGAIRGPRPPLG